MYQTLLIQCLMTLGALASAVLATWGALWFVMFALTVDPILLMVAIFGAIAVSILDAWAIKIIIAVWRDL